MSGRRYHHSHRDYVRERELFRYCQGLEGAGDHKPVGLDILKDVPPVSPNTALTALAQLCALRLNAPRAMISVVDKETQYFIAEATQTLNLSDTRRSECDGDSLWVGCMSVPKEGRLCEKTISLPPIPGKYPCFTVTDLSADERWCQLPFVAGPPHFRFYAGTPLTTDNGVNIGSLFVIDDQVRPELTEDQIDCLGTIAKIVMQTMRTNSEAAERKRSFRMSQGLQSFQDGRDSIGLDDQSGSSIDYDFYTKQGEEGTLSHTNGNDQIAGLVSGYQNSQNARTDPVRAQELMEDPSHPLKPRLETSANELAPDIDQAPKSPLVRAANLLREALDLQIAGGVVFYNAGVSHNYRDAAGLDLEGPENELGKFPQKKDRNPSMPSSPHKHGPSKTCDIASFSTAECPLGTQEDFMKIKPFGLLPENLLHQLLQRYPRGKIWSFDEDGLLLDGGSFSAPRRLDSAGNDPIRNRRQQAEARLLSRYFLNVRQLFLAPLWDSSAGGWSGGCFCYSAVFRQLFSMESELSFLMTFGNSVMAEANRLAYIAAERKKSDFIGSISHELRSPLHGILASAEFLAETEFDGFQTSLVDTISSCGRTLLDTVNHILDYSKINKYERNFFDARKTRAQKSAISIKTKSAVAAPFSKEAPPLMNIFATTDVAAIAEEVVEGVYAGQVYQDISSTEIAYMSHETKGKISDQGVKASRRALQGDPKGLLVTKDVEVILDIEKGDYVFTTQPGALRRILMNLFGNSLKYTDRGSIIVSIRLQDLDTEEESKPEEKMLEITIKDTGKGISNSYLQNNLFTPFSQEDSLATGVGLGLSIVKSIVNMLNGTIAFESQLGEGTAVYVRVPMMRLPGTDTPKSTPSTITSNSSTTTSLQGLQSEHPDKQVLLFGFWEGTRSPILATVLDSYITQWFGLKATRSWSDLVDIVVVDENDLPGLWAMNVKRRPVVVLCGASRPQAAPQGHRPIAMEFVSRPFGPFKLAKALFLCLEKAKGFSEEAAGSTETFPPESPIDSETGTIVPEFSKLSLSAEGGLSSELLSQATASSASSSRHLSSGLSSHSDLNENLAKNKREDFPFPAQGTEENTDAKAQPSRPDLVKRDSRRPKMTYRVTEPIIKAHGPTSSAVSKLGKIATATATQGTDDIASSEIAIPGRKVPEASKVQKVMTPVAEPLDRPPRLLLVDDNKINLRLLETFMRKRKYKHVDSAENGQSAVDAAVTQQDGYDIIFMDISMPVMNGFEATRAIREIEHTRRAIQSETGKSRARRENQALIIALTGLASSRDQTEAYKSGVDLFMTKPVSFKEVGRLLDNWEAHGNEKQPRETSQQVAN